MKLDCIIKNGNLVIPKQGIMEGSIGIKDEKITTIATSLDFAAAKEVIDAKGNYVLPGLLSLMLTLGLGHSWTKIF